MINYKIISCNLCAIILLCQELLVLTHVAEQAVPEMDEALRSLEAITSGKTNANIPEGRVSGVGNIACGYLVEIANGRDTFTEVFNTKDGKFVIARYV